MDCDDINEMEMIVTAMVLWRNYCSMEGRGQWEHIYTILHNDQHSKKQREIKDIDNQIEHYKLQYHSSLYLTRDNDLFIHSAWFIHQYLTQILKNGYNS